MPSVKSPRPKGKHPKGTIIHSNLTFKWDTIRETAAMMLAQGHTIAESAKAAGCSISSVDLWKTNIEFTNRITKHREVARKRLLADGVLNKETRLLIMKDRHDKLTKIMEARGEMYKNKANIAGGDTGLVVVTKKVLGGGPNMRIINEASIDPILLESMRGIEQDIKKEQTADGGDTREILVRIYEGGGVDIAAKV